MLQILEMTGENLIAIKGKDNLTDSDIEKLHPLIDNILNKGQKVRWYFEMEDFSGWNIKAFWKDLKMDLSHADDYEKIAMVGEKKWQNYIAQFMKPFLNAEIEYFDLNNKEQAKEWISK